MRGFLFLFFFLGCNALEEKDFLLLHHCTVGYTRGIQALNKKGKKLYRKYLKIGNSKKKFSSALLHLYIPDLHKRHVINVDEQDESEKAQCLPLDDLERKLHEHMLDVAAVLFARIEVFENQYKKSKDEVNRFTALLVATGLKLVENPCVSSKAEKEEEEW